MLLPHSGRLEKSMSNNKICAPSRIYSAHPQGTFSTSGMIDYMAHMGFDGVDMSLEHIKALDDSWRSVLYSAKNRAQNLGLEIPSCHLPFYMPDPSDGAAMSRFSRDIISGINAASLMEIPMAVIHPIALHAKRASVEKWADDNIKFLTPLCDYASKKGIKLCLENMASNCEGDGDHLYGSAAGEIHSLASALGMGICWDTGHANVSHISPEDMLKLGNRLCLVHAHDNNGYRDSHELPFTGTVDWESVAKVLSHMGYNGYINVEVRAWDVPSDKDTREAFGRKILYAGERIAVKIK